MSMFDDVVTEGLEKTEDRLGGFQVYDGDAYDAKVALAYAGKAPSGAKFIFFEFDMPGGKKYRETVYYTSKAGLNYYMVKDKDKKETGKKAPLPGFTTVDHICLAASEKPLREQATEEKTVMVYDSEQKKDVPMKVPVLVDLLGQPVTLGMFKNLENKSVKVGNNYEPTAETRETNSIDKVFHTETKLTLTEVENQETEAKFYPKWLEKNQGKVQDKRTIKDGQGGAAGKPGSRAPGSPPTSGGAQAPKTSLFGKK